MGLQLRVVEPWLEATVQVDTVLVEVPIKPHRLLPHTMEVPPAVGALMGLELLPLEELSKLAHRELN